MAAVHQPGGYDILVEVSEMPPLLEGALSILRDRKVQNFMQSVVILTYYLIVMHPANSCLKNTKKVEQGVSQKVASCSHSPPKQMYMIQDYTTPGGVVIPLLSRVAARINTNLKQVQQV